MDKPIVKKILRYRNRTTLLSVGEIFPKDWEYIIIKIIEKTDKNMVLEVLRVNSAIEEALRHASK